MDKLERQPVDKIVQSLSGALAQSYEELALLHRISERMQLTQGPETFFGELCHDLREVIDAQQLLVLWRERPDMEANFQIALACGAGGLAPLHLEQIWQETCNRAANGGILLLNESTAAGFPLGGGIRSLVSVPIWRRPNMLGVVAAVNKQGSPSFGPTDIKLISSVAGESAVYLENFRLYQDLQDLLIGSLKALTSSIDAKDPYTSGHSERVAVLARFIAQKMGLCEDQVSQVYLAGLLHDIGKIGIRESVLCKPGRLAKDEFEQIQRHPQIGATILGGIKQMAEVTPAVLTHHEKFGGGGYPHGLSGRDIPLAGRIVMLADSLDAMTSDRTYRKAMPLASALAELRRYSGTQFDPDVADAVLAVSRTELEAAVKI